MASEGLTRRLAAILVADVVGYTRKMRASEADTLADLRALRSEVLEPATQRHRGRTVKTMGDGVLVEFQSAVDAAECALDVQQVLARRNGKAVLRAKALSSVADFRPHDMRHTGASRLTGMGVPRLVVSKLLNHSEGGVTSVYDRHGYDDEKRHALETWAAYVERLITGKIGKTNVVALH